MTLHYLFLPDNPCVANDNSNDNFGTKFTTSKITFKKKLKLNQRISETTKIYYRETRDQTVMKFPGMEFPQIRPR